MANIRTLKLNLLADVSGFNKELEAAQGKMGGFQDKLKTAGRVASIALGGLAAVGMTAVNAASSLNESLSKTEVIFGDSADAIKAFSKTAATELGLSQRAALEAASNFALLGSSAGLTGGDLTGFSKDLTGLATDLASFNNTSVDEAITALAAGLRGESEPLRKFGVLLSASAVEAKAMELGLAETTKELTDQDKVLARNALILEQTTKQQGDFARTSEGAANQQRILAASVENAKANIGQGLLPVYEKFLKLAVGWSETLAGNADAILKVMGVVAALAVGVKVLQVGMEAYSAAVKIAETIQKIFNGTLVMNPIGLVVVSIAALVAILIYAYNNFEPFKNLVDNLFDIMKRFGAFIVDILVAQFQRFVDVITTLGNGLKFVLDRLGLTITAFSIFQKRADGAAAATSNFNMQARDSARAAGRNTVAVKELDNGYKGLNLTLPKTAKGLSKAKQAISEAKRLFDDYSKTIKGAITDQFNFSQAFESKGEGSFLESLRKQAENAKSFGAKLAKLVAMGLNRGALNQIISAGSLVGVRIADELIDGGAGAIDETNALVNDVEEFAQGTAGLITSGLTGRGGGDTINITINGAIDPEGIRRQLERLFQDSARRTGAVSLVGATL